MGWQAATAILVAAFLFGGSLLFSSSLAAFLFSQLPQEEAGRLLRRAFPWFYSWTIVTAVVAAVLCLGLDRAASYAMATIAITTLPTRQLLMPAINRATDQGSRSRFQALHGLSVTITVGHLVLCGWALLRLAA